MILGYLVGLYDVVGDRYKVMGAGWLLVVVFGDGCWMAVGGCVR